jgi:hypothetical protein
VTADRRLAKGGVGAVHRQLRRLAETDLVTWPNGARSEPRETLGHLKREPPMASEIRGLLRSGEARLTDAANRARSLEGVLDVDEGLVDDLMEAAEAVRVALRAADLPPAV